jgi:hypothetical protein
VTIRSQSQSLANLLLQGSFEPAPVQREFQWQQVHVRQLLEDLLGAFQRAGLDPQPKDPAPRPSEFEPPAAEEVWGAENPFDGPAPQPAGPEGEAAAPEPAGDDEPPAALDEIGRAHV